MNCHAKLETMLEQELELSTASDESITCRSDVPAAWREKVTLWFYDVVDHLGEGRSLVYVAMNILDRYCDQLAKSAPMDEDSYELASMTALFLAERIAGSGNLRVSQLTPMSRRGVELQDIVSTGTSMIKTLNFDHRVVTPFDFLPLLLGVTLPNVDTTTTQSVLETANYMIEISVCDESLSRRNPSYIALAAILNSMVAILPDSKVRSYCEVINRTTDLSTHCDSVLSIRRSLENMHEQSADTNHRGEVRHVIEDQDEEQHNVNFPLCAPIVRTVSSDDICSSDDTTIPPASGLKRSHPKQFDLVQENATKKTKLHHL